MGKVRALKILKYQIIHQWMTKMIKNSLNSKMDNGK